MAHVRMPGLLDGELQEVARLRVRAGQFQLSADDVSQATLTIPEDGPAVGLRDWVSLYDEDGLMGIYRVTNIAQTVKRQIQLTLLHGIDILADSYWAEEREYTGNVRGYLEALLQQQTALIDGTAPWALGDCEDTETQLKVKISYGRLSELIREAVPEGGSYQLEYDQSVWPWRVHLRAKPTAAAAEFRVARNITSATITYNDADLCTRLILSNTSGGESRVRVYSAGAIAQAEWGIVTKTASIDTSDTLTSESWPEAEAWVAAFFALHAAPSVQIQIEGRELYRLTGDRWDRASLGRVCRVSLPEYGHVFEERVVSLTYPDPWGDPDRVAVSLANALPQFSEQVKLIEKTAQSASRAAGGAARKADQTAEELERKEVIYQTAFQKTDREISGIASATGLQFNADGTPVLDEDGNFVYSEEHPDNALIAQISLQAGRYDRIIQATGISETPSQGEVSLVTQISQTHQQISNAAIATGLVWVPEDTTVDPPVPGHYEVDEKAISSSVYKQLAGQISQKVTASDVATQVEAYGYTTLTAARNAASAMIGADLKDANGVITSAKIKALVEGDQSLIQLVAQQVDVVAELASYSGDIELQGTLYSEGGFDTIGDSKFEGNLVIDGGDLDLVNGATLKVGGSTLGMVIDTQVVPDGSNGYKLQKKMYGSTSWTDAGSFSRAASIQTVSGSWSGSTYTVAADTSASATPLPKAETLTFTVGTTPSGGASSTTIDRFSSLHKNTLTVKGSSQPSAAYIRQYTIDASGVYTEGETAGKDTGWDDAADAISWPTGSTASVAVTGPLAGGYNDTGTVKTLYLVDDTTNSKILLRDVNSASASGNTYAEKAYTGGSSGSVDDISIENNPISATLVSRNNTRYAQGTANLTAWHFEQEGDVYIPSAVFSDTDTVELDIESILSTVEAAAGVVISGTSVAVSASSGTKSIGISAAIKAANVSYSASTGKYTITPTGRAGSTDMADGSAYTLTPSEAEDAGWNAAADAIVWPTGTGASVSVTVPVDGGKGDTGSKALYLVNDTTNNRILLRDVNDPSATGNTYAIKGYTGGGGDGHTYAQATVSLATNGRYITPISSGSAYSGAVITGGPHTVSTVTTSGALWLYHYGSVTINGVSRDAYLVYKSGDPSRTHYYQQGGDVTYYDVSQSGTTYYKAASRVYVYDATSNSTDYYIRTD